MSSLDGMSTPDLHDVVVHGIFGCIITLTLISILLINVRSMEIGIWEMERATPHGLTKHSHNNLNVVQRYVILNLKMKMNFGIT
jgi:hypothetical protein